MLASLDLPRDISLPRTQIHPIPTPNLASSTSASSLLLPSSPNVSRPPHSVGEQTQPGIIFGSRLWFGRSGRMVSDAKSHTLGVIAKHDHKKDYGLTIHGLKKSPTIGHLLA
ncbi:hypothetical protein ACLOJK_012112 [Asimina triloba]